VGDRSSSRAEARSQFPEGLSPGEVLEGKYLLEEVAGRGGMGVVLAAQHLQLGQRVAIKLMLIKDLTDAELAEARVRFLREAQAAARLASDHVVRIHDVGTLASGAPFMVMELLQGLDLGQTIDRSGPLPIELAVGYLIQVCDAVGEAHARGIVHRDLKPSNVFVARRNDGRASLKVLDFGISKAMPSEGKPLEESLTSTRSVIGSPHYMSPEQIRDPKRVDARTDIWALGAILYECLLGDPAFDADTMPAICAAIAADTPGPLRERRPDVPEALDRIVMRCLEKEPSKRFQSVYELVDALLPFAAGPERLPDPIVVLPRVAANSLSSMEVASAPTVVLRSRRPEAPSAPPARPVPMPRLLVYAALALAATLGLAFWLGYFTPARPEPARPPPAAKVASPEPVEPTAAVARPPSIAEPVAPKAAEPTPGPAKRPVKRAPARSKPAEPPAPSDIRLER
jgi:serine/threonine-protein kinase